MADRYLFHPFRIGAHGGVALTSDPDRHLRDKIEAVLFTSPGERVNRPDFGAGLSRAVFEGMTELTIAALEFRVVQALRRDAGDELIIDRATFEGDPERGELLLRIDFRRRADRVPSALEVRL